MNGYTTFMIVLFTSVLTLRVNSLVGAIKKQNRGMIKAELIVLLIQLTIGLAIIWSAWPQSN